MDWFDVRRLMTRSRRGNANPAAVKVPQSRTVQSFAKEPQLPVLANALVIRQVSVKQSPGHKVLVRVILSVVK
jgi:hypothetical protein